MSNWRPTGKFVLLREVREELKTESGLVIPMAWDPMTRRKTEEGERPQPAVPMLKLGEVVAVGPKVEENLTPGQRILYLWQHGFKVPQSPAGTWLLFCEYVIAAQPVVNESLAVA